MRLKEGRTAVSILIGTETPVNTHLPQRQERPSVTMLEDGGWVVTWQSWQDASGANYGVYQQRYTSSGVEIDGERRVNTTTDLSQFEPTVTALKDGGWVVAWLNDGQNSRDIHQQRYDKNGVAIGLESVVNVSTVGHQDAPTITALPDGGWVVVWQSEVDAGTGNGLGIFQRVYGPSGQASDVQVHSTVSGDQTAPSVAVLKDGGWIVTWQSPDADGTGIYQQRFKADGTREGGETSVNSLTMGIQTNATVTGLKDGGWVVAWQSAGVSGTDIYQRRYDEDGNALGTGETLVNTNLTDDHQHASITALTDGGWVVTWQAPDSDRGGIYLRHYDSSGTAVGGQVLVNTGTADWQSFPSVTALPGGGWVVTWQSVIQGGQLDNIVQKTYFGVNDAPIGTNATLTAKENTAYSFKVADFGFSDTNGNSLSGVKITTLPTKGTVLLNGIAITAGQTVAVADITAGKLTWEPPAGEDGTALTTIGFKVIDDGGTDHNGKDIDQTERVITFNVTPTPTTPDTDKGKILIGDDGDDRFTGTNWADLLSGKGGDDHLDGGAGNDTLWGGEDDDLLKGGSGNDILGGGPGADTLFGGGGDDKLYGGKDSGADRLYGGDGKDKLWAGDGNDKLYGGDDDDTLGGGTGDDLLGGGSGNDILYGGAGSDQIYGGTGDDRIHGGPGNDELWGGAGNDIFIFREKTGKDRIMDFTRGQDKIDLSAFSTRTNPLDFNDISIQTTTAGVVVSINGIQVTLEGQKSLNRDDFIL